jgi:hypothetical protein
MVTIMAKDDQVAAPPLSNITLAQANELRNEITRLNGELYQVRTELRRAHTELDEKTRHVDLDRKNYADWRAHVDRLQEELLAARERNIVLRDKLLAIHRAVANEEGP